MVFRCHKASLLLHIVATGYLVISGCDGDSNLSSDSDTDNDSDSDVETDTDSDEDTDTGSEFVCEGDERTIVIGDIHGDADAAREALRIGGVIDKDDRWIGGPITVIQIGDILDRGKSEREAIDLLMDLKHFAKDNECGAVHILVGNHEIITVDGDYQYLDEEACAGFADLENLNLDQPELAGLSENCKKRGASLLPGGPYAQIMATWPVSLIFGDSIYVHGGLIPVHIDYGLEVTNEMVAQWMLGKEDEPPGTVAYNASSMVWNRTYSEGDPSLQECEILAGILEELNLSHMIVGHSVQGVINSACDEMVWRVDIGMSEYYGGTTQVLQIQDGEFKVLENLN